MSKKSNMRAFTLLELSVVLAIISLILGGGLASFIAYTEKKAYEATQDKIAELQKVLINYRQAHGRLPCPADIELARTDANFGLEADDPGICTSVNFTSSVDTDRIGGMLPVRTLGLDDDMAFDSWGSRLFYAVDKRFTAKGSFVSLEPATIGKLQIGEIGESVGPSAVYVLLSHGENRHGAYPRAGGTVRSTGRDSSATYAVSKTYWAGEMVNCGCNAITAKSTTFTGNFYHGPYTQDPTEPYDVFDDIVVYAKRPQLEP